MQLQQMSNSTTMAAVRSWQNLFVADALGSTTDSFEISQSRDQEPPLVISRKAPEEGGNAHKLEVRTTSKKQTASPGLIVRRVSRS